MGNIVKGKKLMVFVKSGSGDYKSIGFATNHTLSTSASTISVSHKDLPDAGNGKWDDQDIDTLSWTITSENFYANTVEGIGFADIWGYYAAGTVLDLKFGVAADSTTGVPTGGWAVPSTGTVLAGKAIVSSVDVNAPVDDNASFSITFTGKGALTVAE
jgi:predicted secreted protein